MITSVSSTLVTTITTVRNPEGTEANWLNDQQFTRCPSKKVRVAAELAYGLTAATAVVETAVSALFVAASAPFSLVSSQVLKKPVQWLKSSSFSIVWSLAYLRLNVGTPNLPTREDLSRNFAFRGAYENSDVWPKAPLSSRLFMIPRAIPSYLLTAYAVRYKDVLPEKGVLARTSAITSRCVQLCREMWKADRQLTFRAGDKRLDAELTQEWQFIIGAIDRADRQSTFCANTERLDADFDELNRDLEKTNRAICVYFVGSLDSNGAILGDRQYYYHHYKIKRFQSCFDVSAKVVRSTAEIFNHLNDLKATYPDRPIQVVDIASHGNSDNIDIKVSKEQRAPFYSRNSVGTNEFSACSSDAAIILDACLTGAGDNNIAERIAECNPGKRVFAPATPLFFSKPLFKVKQGVAEVDHVTYGPAIVNAYTARKFQVA